MKLVKYVSVAFLFIASIGIAQANPFSFKGSTTIKSMDDDTICEKLSSQFQKILADKLQVKMETAGCDFTGGAIITWFYPDKITLQVSGDAPSWVSAKKITLSDWHSVTFGKNLNTHYFQVAVRYDGKIIGTATYGSFFEVLEEIQPEKPQPKEGELTPSTPFGDSRN